MEQADEDIVEKAFVVRSYGKGELASMYIGGVQQQTAAYRKTVHARASATYNRGVGDAMISTSQDKSIPPVRRIFPFHGMNLFLSQDDLFHLVRGMKLFVIHRYFLLIFVVSGGCSYVLVSLSSLPGFPTDFLIRFENVPA